MRTIFARTWWASFRWFREICLHVKIEQDDRLIHDDRPRLK